MALELFITGVEGLSFRVKPIAMGLRIGFFIRRAEANGPTLPSHIEHIEANDQICALLEFGSAFGIGYWRGGLTGDRDFVFDAIAERLTLRKLRSQMHGLVSCDCREGERKHTRRGGKRKKMAPPHATIGKAKRTFQVKHHNSPTNNSDPHLNHKDPSRKAP